MADNKKTPAPAQDIIVKDSVFGKLAAVNCNEHIEKKNNGKVELSYLSWAWAWHYIKSRYPNAYYTIYERQDGVPYWTDGRTAWVKTGVTIEGMEHIEYLPIMDYRNLSIPLEKITSMDMNKAIQRSLTKAAARHGLGLYIYAGEDIPLSEAEAKELEKEQAAQGTQPAGTQRRTNRTVSTPAPAPAPVPQEDLAKKAAERRAMWVRAIAEGVKTRSGMAPLDAFIKNFQPSEEELAELDAEVMQYRLEHNIPANSINA
ncbi:MAG: DUF1071 domain-containing protein [Bacteroidales bacterium]|nr:DUF1071 domain-containing protein [Bacteroidales bacterium]